jgi:hypothetical protein
MDNVRRARRGLLIFMLALVASTFGMIYREILLDGLNRERETTKRVLAAR